ncbi:hypothetical protein [Saezia sanguinis]|uniref:hypothetical protein n=1 Tax=Saezia sanguinis TaxID=1965230 RepID=UPI003055ADF2
MTVSTSSSQVGPYRGDDISTVFAVGFPFLESEHLHVVVVDAANEVCLAPDVDYHVIATEAGDGQVELAQPLAAGKMLTILRKVPVTQLVNYVQGDIFPAKQHETALDKLTMIAQELVYEAGRAVKLPEADEGEFVLPSVSQRKNALLGFDAGGLPQAVKVGDGLITEQHMLMVNANMGIISNAAGVSLLIGDGLGAYNSAIVVKPGDGLDFDAQAQLRLKTELLNAINRNAAILIDLRGLLSNLMRRIANLEMGGGTEVTIYIGDGLRYDEDGNLTVKPGVGIEVNVDGVNVLLGDGLEIGAQGQMQVSQTLREGISQMQRNVNAGISVPFNQEFCAEIGGYPKGSVLLGADGVTLWQNTVDANMTDPDSTGRDGWVCLNAPKVAFCVTGGVVQTIAYESLTQVTGLTTVNFNMGSGYSDGRFTAPVAGIYDFKSALYFSGVSGTAIAAPFMRIDLLKNGVNTGSRYLFSATRSDGSCMITGEWLEQLDEGDVITLHFLQVILTAGVKLSASHSSFFSGKLVQLL